MNDTTIVLRRRPGPRSWLALGAATAAVLVMLLLIAVACQAANRTDDDLSAPPPSSASDASPAASGDGTGDGDSGGGGDGSGSGSGQTGGGQDAGGQDGGGQDGGDQQPTTPPGPVIEYFRVAQEPACEGTPRELVLEWRVAGAERVTLSIDGPGPYADYGPEERQTVPFACGERRHTYLLTATDADGRTATRELAVEVPDG